MKFVALFALISVAACISIPFDSELDEFWESFKNIFNKSYEKYEESARRLIWERNVADIVRHNLRADMGFHSYKRGINKYSDMSSGEFDKAMNGLKRRSKSLRSGSTWLPPTNAVIPDRVDWRREGYVTEVKDQGNCGSCWAFSSTGSLEGQHMKKTGKLVSLSEQNLVDCSKKEGNSGCDGGWMDQAFDYVKHNHGIDTEMSYPYKHQEGICHFKNSTIGATCTGYVDIPEGDEEALKIAVATVGPISVAINADGDFGTYESGVYKPMSCPNEMNHLTHGVLVVGYGTHNGKDYWLVKNSWGDSWGLSGYIKMARNHNNTCGIATAASYPLV